MMTELKIKFKSDISKDELRKLAVSKNVLALYEKKFPEKVKKSPRRTASSQGKPDAAGITSMMFQMLDTNQDGIISRSEADGFKTSPMAQQLEGRGLNAQMVDQMFNVMDSNKDGKVTKMEADVIA